MSKIVLNDVTNLSSLSVINDNFDKIEQEFQSKVHYRDNPEGEPNTFENDVDLNGNSIYNVENLTVANTFTVNGKNVEEVVDDAIAGVEQSALSAANSATAAANSAVSAASSATSATASAATATTKASESSTSATNAGNSATAAASSATASASSATAASGSATSAASSASTATTQATNASSSASAAATSATNAANSATASASSATSSASSASSSAASAAAAAASLDNFDDRYLGSKANPPTVDNDGNTLVTGALYYNDGTVLLDNKGMWIWDGVQWIKASAATQAILVTYEYLATAGQTTFSGNDANGVPLAYTVGSIIVSLNGVKLRPGNDFTASNGTSVVLVTGAAAGDDLVIDAFSTFDVANMYTKAEVDGFAVKLTGSQSIAGVKTFSDRPLFSGGVDLNANGQIKFPATQNASSDANTLDDYEEGGWTPTLTSTATPPTVSSYDLRSGSYIKVGKLVTLTATIRATITSIGNGTPTVTGFPFSEAGQLDAVSIGLKTLLNTANINGAYVGGSRAVFDNCTYTTSAQAYLTFTVTYTAQN